MINKKRIAKTAVALMTTAMLIQAVPAHADSVHVAKEGIPSTPYQNNME